MRHADRLRKQAARCREAASVPTTGSATADRILLDIAAALEDEAACVEGGHYGSKPRPTSFSARYD